jgi:hypothetical protein
MQHDQWNPWCAVIEVRVLTQRGSPGCWLLENSVAVRVKNTERPANRQQPEWDDDAGVSEEFGRLVAPQAVSAYRTHPQTLSRVGVRTNARAEMPMLQKTQL